MMISVAVAILGFVLHHPVASPVLPDVDVAINSKINNNDSQHVKGRIFNVGVSPRNYGDEVSYVYTIDNVKSKTLHLIRNHTYLFVLNVFDPIFRLVFTSHPLEGKHPFLVNTKSKYIRLDANNLLPSYFYYQDHQQKCMGGLVKIHSKEEYEKRKEKKKKNI